MTILTETKENIINHLYNNNDWTEETLRALPGVRYCHLDGGGDVAYVLTTSSDLLVVDTDTIRVRTSAQMHAAGMCAASVPSIACDRLGIAINEDWTIN